MPGSSEPVGPRSSAQRPRSGRSGLEQRRLVAGVEVGLVDGEAHARGRVDDLGEQLVDRVVDRRLAHTLDELTQRRLDLRAQAIVRNRITFGIVDGG